jgi:hypothetical protein
MTLTQTLAWRRSGVVSTEVMVAEADARVGHVATHDRSDLLAEGSSSTRSVRWLMSNDRRTRSAAISAGNGPANRCDVKHSMTSPSSRSWKFANPMPHS